MHVICVCGTVMLHDAGEYVTVEGVNEPPEVTVVTPGTGPCSCSGNGEHNERYSEYQSVIGIVGMLHSTTRKQSPTNINVSLPPAMCTLRLRLHLSTQS